MSQTPSPEAPGLLNWVLVTLLGVIWGAAFMSVSVALEGFGPLSVAALRVSIAALALAAIGAAMGQGPGRLRTRREWGFAGVIGAVSVALPFTALAWGQQFVPSAYAGVVIGSVPLLVLPLVAIFSPEEGIGPRRVIGLLTGFAGLVVLFAPGAAGAEAPGQEMLLPGLAAFLLAACCYAAGSVLTRRAPRMPPVAFAAATLAVASALLLPLALAVEGWPRDWPALPTLALLYAALGPTALASVIRVRVITTAGSLFMSVTSYMVPIWSVVFGIALLGEALPPQLFTALGLTLLGIGIAQSRAIAASLRRRKGGDGA